MPLHPRKGFTLIELLLYVSIASIVLLATSLLLSSLLSARVKDQTIAEVDQQGVWAMQTMAQELRNAASINTPSVGGSASSLSLATYSNATTPTVFDLSGGTLRVTIGNKGTPTALTNNRVSVSGLTFENLSRPNTPGIVRIIFTVSAINPSGRNEYSYARTFTTSAALRQP